MGRGAWWAAVQEVAKSQTRPNNKHYSKLPSLWQFAIAALETQYRVVYLIFSTLFPQARNTIWVWANIKVYLLYYPFGN